MAKSDTPLDEIHLRRAYSPPHKPKWASDMSIHGYDTETADGDVFMLSVAFEGYGGFVEQRDGELLTPKQLWDYITHKRARSSLNMWYNLNFDANVLLKHLLDDEEMAVLVTSGSVDIGKYEITYIPGKFLRVRDSNKHVYTHYDASQFFYTSLENAAEEWLGRDKLSDTIDVTKFGKQGDSVNDYIKDNWSQIKKYARVDAELVRDLWQEAVSVGEGLDIPMGRPFSTGYLAESYLNAHLKEKPGMGPREMAKLAWDTYAGGRFEVIKRGNIGPVAGPDINSAYPHILAQLPDPKTLTWENAPDASVDKLRDADFGFVRARVTTDKERPIQPFAIKRDSKLKYPALEDKEISCVKDIFVNAHDYDYLKDFEIVDAWLGYDEGGAWYPFDFIDSLYDKRKSFEADGLMKKGQLLKIVLNSMYGKTCQTTPKRKQIEDTYHLDDNESHVSSMSLPSNIREAYENGFIEWLESGAWFNPFLASYITGLTRLELHKRILEYGLEEATVMLATDSLMIEKGPFEASNFANDLVKDGLGNWDYDYKGKAFVIGAGVYQVDYPDGTSKTKTRGFNESDISGGLRQAAKLANGHLEIESLRPKTVAEAIWQGQEVSDVGQFLEHTRELKPDMDDKRQWQGEATFSNLLSKTEMSKPIVLSG